MNMIFINQPGKLYDLLCIVAAYFQQPSQGSCRTWPLVDDEMLNYIQSENFGRISEDLALLFEAREDGKIFAIHDLFPALLDKAGTEVVWQDIFEHFTPQALKRRVYSFYLHKPMPDDPSAISCEIERSDLSRKKRYQLLVFCVDYHSIVENMASAMEKAGKWLAVYQKEVETQLKDSYKKIKGLSTKAFVKRVGEIPGHMVRWSAERELHVSFSAVNRYALERLTLCPIAIIGWDYEKTVAIWKQDKKDYDLIAILAALGDPVRIRLMKRMQKGRGSANLLELSVAAGVTTPTAKYQLSVMLECGLIQTKRERKKIYYRLNPDCCTYISRNVPRLLGDGPEFTVEEKSRGDADKWWLE